MLAAVSCWSGGHGRERHHQSVTVHRLSLLTPPLSSRHVFVDLISLGTDQFSQSLTRLSQSPAPSAVSFLKVITLTAASVHRNPAVNAGDG